MIVIAANIHPIADANNQKLCKGDPVLVFNVEREHVRTKKKKDYYDDYKEHVLNIKPKEEQTDDSWWRSFKFDD